MDLYINRDRILAEADDLELELLEFLNDRKVHSLQRWLLTLTHEEVNNLADKYEVLMNDENFNVDKMSLIPFIILMSKGQMSVSEDDLFNVIKEVNMSVILINMVNKKLLNYVMEDDDKDWKFSVPDDVKKRFLNGEIKMK